MKRLSYFLVFLCLITTQNIVWAKPSGGHILLDESAKSAKKNTQSKINLKVGQIGPLIKIGVPNPTLACNTTVIKNKEVIQTILTCYYDFMEYKDDKSDHGDSPRRFAIDAECTKKKKSAETKAYLSAPGESKSIVIYCQF